MKRKGKWVFFVVALLVLFLSYSAFFGIYTEVGDTDQAAIKGAGDIRWGIDIRGGIDATFGPVEGVTGVTDDDVNSMREVIAERLVRNNITDHEIYADTANQQVIVRFPWSNDEEDFDVTAAIEELGKTAMLEFHIGSETTTKKDDDGNDVLDENGNKIVDPDPDYTGTYRDILWKNKAITELYYPGSVFKVITAAMGVDSGKATYYTTFNCSGAYGVAKETYHCAGKKAHGVQNLAEALRNSCNIYFIQLGQRVGSSLFYDYFDAFGFTERTGVDLPNETGMMKYYTKSQLGEVELSSSSFGQAMAVTPLQVCTAISAAVNGGYLVTPHVVDKITDTNGNGIMNSVFDGYEPYKGDIPQRVQGSLVAFETGETSGYGLFNAQDRGIMFVGPGLPVYEGMIVGQSPKNEDVAVNVCKKKHVTNMRAAGSDEALRLTPPTVLSLEQSLEFINDDELVEVTPKSIRLRKRILSKEQRMKEGAKKKA